jgi:hypothetical protein
VNECNKIGGSTRFLPDYPVILMQYLSQVDDETVSTVFNIPPSELKVASLAQAYDTVADRSQRAASLAKVVPAAGVQNVFAALLNYFVFLRSSLLTADQRKAVLAAGTAQDFQRAFQGVAEEVRDMLGYFIWFLGKKFVPAMHRSEFEDPEMVVAAVVAPVIFWDSQDMRRVLNDIPRGVEAVRKRLAEYQMIFPERQVAALVAFGESQASVELRKRQAKQKYEAEELERSKMADEKERAKAKKVLNQKVTTSTLEDKRAKEELDQLVTEQMSDFKHRKEDAENSVKQGQTQFEMLQKQQQEAKARADAKRKQLKEKARASSSQVNASSSEASLDSFLTTLDTTKGPENRKSRLMRDPSRKSSSSSVLLKTAGPKGEIPMIKIPELQLTPGQQKMMIIIPPLPQ